MAGMEPSGDHQNPRGVDGAVTEGHSQDSNQAIPPTGRRME